VERGLQCGVLKLILRVRVVADVLVLEGHNIGVALSEVCQGVVHAEVSVHTFKNNYK
jgi:hypothetical protein